MKLLRSCVSAPIRQILGVRPFSHSNRSSDGLRKPEVAVLLLAASITLLVDPACLAQPQPALTHHVREVLERNSAKLIGRLAGQQTLHLVLTLPLQNQAELEGFIQSVSDPSRSTYHHFLTVEQFAQRFGPRQEDYDSVLSFAKANGLKVVGISRNRLNVEIEAPAAKVESALHVQLNMYQHPTEKRTFYAPDREPTLDLAVRLWHISGLDNFSIPRSARSSRPPEQFNATAIATTGSGPSGSFLGSDMRAAYYGGSALTGSGQTIGLLEFAGVNLADLNTYFTNIGQTNNVPISLVSTDGARTSCSYSSGCDDTEQILDMTQAIGMAPGLSKLVVYVGSSDASLLNAMATASPLDAQLSISWSWTPADPATDDPYFLEFAAQGQSVFVAAGDTGAWNSSTVFVYPADDPYITSVGGTDLQTGAAAGPWRSESVWVNGGGGISTNFLSIPSWQTQSVLSCPQCSSAYRNGPDVGANANWTFYVCSNQTTCTSNYWGGTSFAAPMWAGYMALANQQSVTQGHGTIGFINPALYSFAGQSEYASVFHDVTSGSNGYAATTDYDLATGLGSPNGTALIDSLTLVPNIEIYPGSASLSIAPSSNGSTSITTRVVGGFDSAISLSASGQPSGVTVDFGSTTIAAPGNGSTQMTVAVSPTITPGTYPVTITAAGGGVTQTASVSLIVPTPTFSLSASPNAVSIVQGTSGISTISVSTQSGFDSAVELSASGQPAGVTVNFSPLSIGAPGNGSSQMTITVASTAAKGFYPIVVTASGGGITETATVFVSVLLPPDFNLEFTALSSAQLKTVTNPYGVLLLATIPLNDFNSSITLSVAGLPSGVTAGFDPLTVSAPGYSNNITLTLFASPTTAGGMYPVTVSATGGGITHTVTGTITVIAEPDFTWSATLRSAIAYQGSGDLINIQTAAINGFNSSIQLILSGQPAGVSVNYAPMYIPANGAGTIGLAIAPTTIPGTYPITISAVAPGIQRTTTVNLTILSGQMVGSLSFNPVKVGSSSAALPLSITFNSAAQFGSTSVLSQGVSDLDFKDAGTGTCVPNTSYSQGQTCSVNIVFSPKFPGLRNGAVVFKDPNGNEIASGTIEGSGVGPQVGFLPGNQSTLTGGFTSPRGIAVDGDGNVFVVDFFARQVKELLAVNGRIPASPTVKVVATMSGLLDGLAIDGKGNLYVSDAFTVYELSSSSGYAAVLTIGGGFFGSSGLAVDGNGNVFVADTGNSAVKEIPAGCTSSSCVKTLGSGFFGPTAVAVDSTGDVFVADAAVNSNSVQEILAEGDYTTTTTLLTGLNQPRGMALDAQGNLYVADTDNNKILEILKAGGYSNVKTVNGNFLTSPAQSPYGLALSESGNLYASLLGNSTVTMMDFADQPKLSFASTSVGSISSDSPQTITLENIGNVDLVFPVPASGSDPSINPNFQLSSNLTGACPVVNSGSFGSGKLAAGSSCVLPISFAPTSAGTLSGSLILTDNNLNAAGPEYTSQGISLSGVGESVNAAIVSPLSGSTLAGSSASFSWTAQTGSTRYVLYVGSTVGGREIYSLQTSSLSATVVNLPLDGRPIYTTLYGNGGGSTAVQDSANYTAADITKAVITSPVKGSTLAGSSATFSWTAQTGSTRYVLYVGSTVGGREIYSLQTSSLSATVVNLPLDGRQIYITLYGNGGGSTAVQDTANYTAAIPHTP